MLPHKIAQASKGAEPPTVHHNWAYQRIVLPVFALLRMGASPKKLAWSIAIGMIIGINPLLGSTTILCFASAFAFRLNIAASQLGNHIVYPLQILLVVPFLHLGTRVFHTGPLPLSTKEMLASVRSGPIALARQLWLWERHGLIIWAAFAVILTPLIALSLTPLLNKLLVRIERHQYPILQSE